MRSNEWYDSDYATIIQNFCFSLHPKWEFSHIGIPVKKIFELRMHFLDLIRNDVKTSNWSSQCQKVLQLKHAPLCQTLLRKGQTPTQYRGIFWSYVLGSHVESYVRWLLELKRSKLMELIFFSTQGSGTLG